LPLRAELAISMPILAKAARASLPARSIARFMYCRYTPACRASSRDINV